MAGALFGFLALGLGDQASASGHTHVVQSGDTLWRIATSNNLSVDQVMSFNQLSSSTIHIGQVLLLHAPSSNTSQTYTVKSGDSLFGIARNHQTTVAELKTVNNLTSDLIRVGQVLTIPGGGTAPLASTSTATSYTVKSGDSLWRIATNHNLTVQQLQSMNNLTSDNIFVGQVLRLTASGTTPAPTATTTFNADALIAEARKYLGVPYVWGGSTPAGFDCSGFLNYVYNNLGVSIPRTVATIWSATTPVSAPRKGDIVFFETATGPSHAGIYMGDNKFIHAGSSTGVTIADMNNSYWKPRYLGARAVR